MVRDGDIELSDLVAHHTDHADGRFIIPKPLQDLKVWREEDHPRDRRGRFGSGGGGDKPKVPKWKRNRRYNGWVRSLSPDEQEALARQFYAELWSQLEAYFGDIGMPPPELIFTDNMPSTNAAQVFVDSANGIRQVQMRPTDILRLALRNPLRTYTAATIAHEWRHVFQNASLYSIDRDKPHDDQPIEQDAIAFAALVMRTMKRNRKRKRQHKPLIQPVPYNPENIAENIGKDPTTIPYP